MAAAQITAVRSLVDSTRASASLTPGARARALRTLRQDLADLVGQIDTYLADAALQESASAITEVTSMAQARENADIREQLLRAGAASGEELDKLGLVSHDAIDAMDSDGMLQQALADGTIGRRIEEALLPLTPANPEAIIWPEGVEGSLLTEADSAAGWEQVTTKDRDLLRSKHGEKAHGVSLKKDAKGYFVHTHRARSKSYPTVDDIPKDDVDFIESTG